MIIYPCDYTNDINRNNKQTKKTNVRSLVDTNISIHYL